MSSYFGTLMYTFWLPPTSSSNKCTNDPDRAKYQFTLLHFNGVGAHRKTTMASDICTVPLPSWTLKRMREEAKTGSHT